MKVNTGNSFLIIPVASPEVLSAIKPCLSLTTQLSEELNVVDFYVFCLLPNTRTEMPVHACLLPAMALGRKHQRVLLPDPWLLSVKLPYQQFTLIQVTARVYSLALYYQSVMEKMAIEVMFIKWEIK